MDKIKLWILNRKTSFIVISILIIIFISLYIYINNKNTINQVEIINDYIETNTIIEEIKEEIIEYISVDIKGYINKPGVYKVDKSKDYRINDLISIAGGLKKNADTSLLNLSTKLKDEMVIIIYSKDEISNFIETINNTKNKLKICETQSIINDACIKEIDIINNTDSVIQEKININEASKEVLMTIPGIGESKANSIIDYRNNNGNFNTIEDIKNVSGIGDKFFEQIKEYITI